MKSDVLSDILSMNLKELESLMASLNQPTYRAAQVFEWLHKRGASSFQEMDNLPKTLRIALAERGRISACHLVELAVSKQDDTHKFLFELLNGLLIESVRMKYSFGHSICISTQAGCKMGCKFCASGANGLIRDLTAGEMCAQVYAAANYRAASNAPSKSPSIVLMGCGEPLDNFDSSLRFIELITHPKGAAIGARHITISTCGLVPEIKKLADLKLQVNLAISLHAPDDHIRKALMPIANRYPLNALMDACRYYLAKTNRRITFEYSLISGINDSPSHATALSKLLANMLCHVNLIPVNPYSPDTSQNSNSRKYLPSTRKEAEAFASILERKRIPTTIRRTIGADVNAACGQLRAKGLSR